MISKSLIETEKIAQTFLANIPKNKFHQATVVGLFGDLGSGKTAFTQIAGKILGVKETITSPTFVIEKRYDLDGRFGFKKLIHIDAYRLESGQEILNLGFKEDLSGLDNLILIEWPERIMDILPKEIIKINLKFISKSEREIML